MSLDLPPLFSVSECSMQAQYEIDQTVSVKEAVSYYRINTIEKVKCGVPALHLQIMHAAEHCN